MEEKDEVLNPEDFEDNSKEDGNSNEENQNEGSKEEESKENAKSQQDAENEEQKKKNAEYAKKRREQEEAKRKADEAKLRAEVEKEVKLGIHKVNPYTNQPIKDEEDLSVYEVMKQLDDEGKDPINDYPAKVAELNRKSKEEAKKKIEAEQKEKENFAKDIAEFQKAYPNVNLRELADNEEFIKFSENKAGRWSTIEIYEAYIEKQEMKKLKKIDSENDKKAEEKAKNITKTPKPSNNQFNNSTLLDKDPSKMSKEELAKYKQEFKEYWDNKYNGSH